MHCGRNARRDEIYSKTVDFIEDFGMTAYPIDPFEALRKLGVELVPYSSLSAHLRRIAEDVSSDAFTIAPSNYDLSRTKVVYNDAVNLKRMRFSLAHELGHMVLEHEDCSRFNEVDANYFASYFLAPTPIIVRDSIAIDRAIEDDFIVSGRCSRAVLERVLSWQQAALPLTDYEKRVLDNCWLDRSRRIAIAC